LALALGGILATAVLYRVLGPVTYGVWATVAAFRAFALFLEGGLVFGAAGATARYPSDASKAGREVQGFVGLGLVCGVAAAVIAVLISWVPGRLLDLDGDLMRATVIAMVILGLEVAMALATGPLIGVARGAERNDAIALAAVGQAIVVIVLTVALTPAWGLVGAGVALLVGRLAGTLVVAASIRHSEVAGFAAPRLGSGLGRPLAFAAPLWLIAVGSQIGLGTDVPIVGAFFGPAIAGAYAVGAVVPATALAALYSLTDAAYPRIARHEPTTALLMTRLLLVGTMLAGLGFTVLGILGPVVLQVWVGVVDPIAVDVLRVYCLAWALNVPAHVLALHAMATSTHRALVPVVLGEAFASFALSVLLASAGLPIGPALATLLTLAVSNLVIVPALTLPNAGIDARTAATKTTFGYALGIATGAAVGGLCLIAGFPPFTTLLVAGGCTLAAAGALLYVLVVRQGAFRRITSVVRNGGIRVWIRQRREVQQARERLGRVRVEQPVVWIPSAPPLVSVRIATYNRGEIVRDRAIASALAQTHPNVEVVVVGDHCDAATEAAVRSVSDPRVRFENLAERGRYPADPQFRWMVAGSSPMNRALDLARGEWIAPLDDDDEFTPDHIEVLLDACRTRGLELAYGIAETEVEPGVWDAVGSTPLRHGTIVHAAVLFRRAIAFIRHDLEAWRLYEPGDWNVWHRMRDAGVRIGFVDHVVTRHFLERRELR
jgi:O-antigen/teichoic acid export membrane protein